MFMFKFMGFLYLFVTITADDVDNVYSEIFHGNIFPSAVYIHSNNPDMTLTPHKKTPPPKTRCEKMYETDGSNYVVMLVYKTSGRFMGMGGIIDRETIITANDVIKVAYRSPEEILVVAGYFSPWWGRNAQVRRCVGWMANDYQVVLARIDPAWKFGGSVNSIELKRSGETPLTDYVDDFIVHGIRTDHTVNHGDFMAKTVTYNQALHSLAKPEECEKNYDVKSFNSTINICLNPNATYCWGCIGSPVIGLRKAPYGGELVGIVIKSSCPGSPLKVLAVNIQFFESWIEHHSL